MEHRIVSTCFGDMYVDGDRLVSVGDENLYYTLPDIVWTAEEIQEFCQKLENLPKNENGEIIGTDMGDDGSLIGEPGKDGSDFVLNEK